METKTDKTSIEIRKSQVSQDPRITDALRKIIDEAVKLSFDLRFREGGDVTRRSCALNESLEGLLKAGEVS